LVGVAAPGACDAEVLEITEMAVEEDADAEWVPLPS